MQLFKGSQPRTACTQPLRLHHMELKTLAILERLKLTSNISLYHSKIWCFLCALSLLVNELV